jgi:hypothetical protein
MREYFRGDDIDNVQGSSGVNPFSVIVDCKADESAVLTGTMLSI